MSLCRRWSSSWWKCRRPFSWTEPSSGLEQIVDARVPQVVEELAEVFRVFSKDRIQQRTVEQIIPAIPLAGKIVELFVIQTRQSVNACVQHLVNTVKVEKYKIIEETVQRMEPIIKEKINQATKHIKIPQAQFLDMLVGIQRQILVAQTMQETMEVLLLQFSDKVVDIPVVAQRQISTVHIEMKTAETPQLQIPDDVIDVPAVSVVQVQVVEKTTKIQQLQDADKVVNVSVLSVVQAPLAQVMAKTVQTPQLLFREKIVVIPRIQMIQGPQTSESLNGEISTFQLEMQMGTMFVEEQDVLTKVNADLEQVACETCVKDNTAMVAREGTSSTSGSKHQQRTSGQAGKEEGEKKKMDGGKKEEREAEEGGSELVEKDVTGWTEVTRNKRKKVVQIFVKVHGMKTVAMEVSPEDKV